MLKQLNPFHRRDQEIAALQSQITVLQDILTRQSEINAAVSEQIAALVRDDQQIAALRRIANATEYLQRSEKRHRQDHGRNRPVIKPWLPTGVA
jgi:hypothetical protein